MYGCAVAIVPFVAGTQLCAHVQAHAEVSACNNSHCAPSKSLATCNYSSTVVWLW